MMDLESVGPKSGFNSSIMSRGGDYYDYFLTFPSGMTLDTERSIIACHESSKLGPFKAIQTFTNEHRSELHMRIIREEGGRKTQRGLYDMTHSKAAGHYCP